MQFSYSFLQHSSSNQFKDMAFFEMLKRKGPYIERSLTKIENDLFYRHKLQGGKMKNMTFIKQIRLTLSAYEVLVNEIRNDFSMTELDILGDSIHKLFSQMISIINFFVAVALKKQKLALDQLRQMSLQEVRQKQVNVKKQEQDQIAKVLEQAERQKNDMFKQIQRLKFNFNSLFKMQMDSDKQKNDMEKAWLSIVQSTIENAKQSILIKDSELEKIIKDSCEYLYKNHSELDRIVKLTKQDIAQGQKSIQTFGDQKNLLQQNSTRIEQMKQMAKKLVKFVREKVYGRTQAMVQTDLTLDDGSKVMMTTKELDEKRRNEAKIRSYERQLKEKDHQINQIDIKLKQTEMKLKKALQFQIPEQPEQKSNNIEPIREQPKKRTFPSNNNQQTSPKFLNYTRNNRTKNVKTEQLARQKTKQYNSVSIPSKVSAATATSNSHQVLLNHSQSTLINQSNNSSKGKKVAQWSSHTIEKNKLKNEITSQHEMIDQKTSNIMSQLTINDGKRNYKQRMSAPSEENKNEIEIRLEKQREQRSEKQKKQSIVEKKQQSLQEEHQEIDIPRVSKKFYKSRKSIMILQAKSFAQMNRGYVRSRQNTIEQQESEKNDNQHNDDDQQPLKSIIKQSVSKNNEEKPQPSSDNVSIGEMEMLEMHRLGQSVNHHEHKLMKTQSAGESIQRSNKLQLSVKKSQNEITKFNTLNLTINHTIKLTIRPFFIKRYLQSTYNHPITQQKLRQHKNKLSQQNQIINKIEKVKKSNSQSDFAKLCFEALDIGSKVEEGVPNRREPKMKLLWSNQSKMVKSSQTGNLGNDDQLHLSRNKQQIHRHQSSDISITPENNTVGLLKLKNQTKERFHSLCKDQEIVLNKRIRSPVQFSYSGRKQRQKNLRKSSMARQNSTFYLQYRNRDGLRTSQFKR